VEELGVHARAVEVPRLQRICGHETQHHQRAATREEGGIRGGEVRGPWNSLIGAVGASYAPAFQKLRQSRDRPLPLPPPPSIASGI
jgi:hypothetical protein